MKIKVALWCIVTSMSLYAQDDIDALRIANTQIFGTARSMGVSNSFSAVGADLSNIYTNPASIGRYSSNEVGMTLGVPIRNLDVAYNSNKTNNRSPYFNLQHAGAVFNLDGTQRKLNIGVGFSQIADYKELINTAGFNTDNSILVSYAEQLDGVPADQAAKDYPFEATLPYITGLLFKDTLIDAYYPIAFDSVQQQVKLKRTGSIQEASIAMSFALNKKITAGIGIGVPILNFTEEYYFKEQDIYNVYPQYIYMDRTANYAFNGVGLNLKLGFHAQPSERIRFAAAVTTPSIYFVNNTYQVDFIADFDSVTRIPDTQLSEFKYKFNSPMRWNTGFAYVHPKYGFISLEYEGSLTQKSKYKFDEAYDPSDNYQNYINDIVANKYKPIHNLRGGIEAKAGNLRLRTGVSYRTSPFVSDDISKEKRSSMSYSAGIGVYKKSWKIDLGYAYSKSKETIVPYALQYENTPNLDIHKAQHNFALSLGYKF